MLCDVCKFKDDCVDYGWSWCKKFTPKPKPIEEQTNEEWFCSLNTEQKAKAITDFIKRTANAKEIELNINKEAWIRWLKEKHK